MGTFSEFPSWDTYGYYWRPGQVINLGLKVYPFAINGQSKIVGYFISGDRQNHAFLYDGELSDLGTLGGGSAAYGINEKGQIVGYSESADGLRHAFLFDGTMHDLGTLDGRPTIPQGINESGEIVGYADPIGSTSTRTAFLYDGTMRDLGTLGGTQSLAVALNDHGLVVGYVDYATIPGESDMRAFVARDGAMVDLNTLIDPSTSYTLTEAFDVNNSGQIVCHERKPDIFGAAYLLTPTSLVETSLGGAEALGEGTWVSVQDAVVVAVGLEANTVFVESSDRSAGIKLITTRGLSVGQRIEMTGLVRRIKGEREICLTKINSVIEGSPLSPVGMNSSTIGNDRTETLKYTGLDTTGLLIRYWGTVTGVSSSQRVIYVDDGGSYQDGLVPYRGLRVKIAANASLPAKGSRVAITGVSRVEEHTLVCGGEVNGDWYPSGTVVYVPAIWTRDASDIQILR
ncbi:MAG: hypothetical protein HYX78_15465 [Armatimonadetes bacterium]|nr:hypothetical protein [Armatimonadota bacterium]